MKKLFWLITLLLLLFIVSSVFKGGEYVRRISSATGVNLKPVAEIADTLSLGDFMDTQGKNARQSDKKRAGQ
jgi:hypothetical protein